MIIRLEAVYAAPFHKIYVSDERAKAEAVVDVAKDQVIKTLHFLSETGNVRYDPVSRHIFVNLQDKNAIADERSFEALPPDPL